jgi:hypothetical protein
MPADKNPTTLPPLKAEHDSKIAGRNAGGEMTTMLSVLHSGETDVVPGGRYF